ncbi:uncharacterized protein L969DRAFT_95832 [Mixia osmundae IAM 14324]|uniref:Anaphase-promoting complex subunit 4 WD40 domain-containing protein n=1 Tax=Mixia osmundae (strain CBS 9802 / IAM 14324 / JCM 22182 / KY 12970) TaxID=764103 RepID=G7DSF8_MIXOS|nr:uncharacterized protein L969DRAFT_95832 [Mixia osmundae IAM 14324]KEI37987.1 hypothetical protein L969DRAFT_95832 [Mixia osmundae IAM 14324]GAA93518.1 hypothetical protein E5Q_00159 [Mixia osmundae IAM 14324]
MQYESPVPVFALGFSTPAARKENAGGYKASVSHGDAASTSPAFPSDLRLGIGSYVEGYSDNSITILGADPSRQAGQPGSFVPLARASHPYPCTALQFSPAALAPTLQASMGHGSPETREMVATSSECLRLWDLRGDGSTHSTSSFVGRDRRQTGWALSQRAVLANSKAEYSAPLTSFSWNDFEPSYIVTSSIDTTCTIWDISTSSAVTQLIAHDREVFDVSWRPSTRDVFASVGADGSVRMFDLRSLEHSTILYEASTSPSTSANGKSASDKSSPSQQTAPSSTPSPLLRLAFNPKESHSLAILHADAKEVLILDVRHPGVPVAELSAHQAIINDLCWSSDGKYISTCSDDHQVLVWDPKRDPSHQHTRSSSHERKSSVSRRTGASPTATIKQPLLAYTAEREVNSMAMGGLGKQANPSSNAVEWMAINRVNEQLIVEKNLRILLGHRREDRASLFRVRRPVTCHIMQKDRPGPRQALVSPWLHKENARSFSRRLFAALHCCAVPVLLSSESLRSRADHKTSSTASAGQRKVEKSETRRRSVKAFASLNRESRIREGNGLGRSHPCIYHSGRTDLSVSIEARATKSIDGAQNHISLEDCLESRPFSDQKRITSRLEALAQSCRPRSHVLPADDRPDAPKPRRDRLDRRPRPFFHALPRAAVADTLLHIEPDRQSSVHADRNDNRPTRSIEL